jgi:formamidopyrimidine-DNA glycosylase
MTGRIFVAEHGTALPKHTAVVFDLGSRRLVFEDTRYFGRLTLDAAVLARLGPEPLADAFTPEVFAIALGRSAQAIKIKLLDQALVAGVGNIYASEALFRARLSPRLAARRLRPEQIRRLWQTIRDVLGEAIACGSTLPLNFGSGGNRDGLFYFGRVPGAPDYYNERLLVYDRDGQPCTACGVPLRRIVQAARSTFFCPGCQR